MIHQDYKQEGCAIGKATPRGHYCKVCGQHKANELFSGKGHAAHICKECGSLTPSERAEAMALTRLYSLPLNRLDDSQKKWLENRIHDKRPAVKELAREVYRQHYPHAERNAMKKQLRIDCMEFTSNTMLCDENWDEIPVQCKFTLDRKDSIVTMQELGADIGAIPMALNRSDTTRLLKWMLHSLEIFCWDEDYCGERTEPASDFDLADFPGFEFLAPHDAEGGAGDPSWSVRLKYASGQEQYMECFELGLPARVEELYRRLAACFYGEDDEDEFDFMELAYGCADLTALQHLVSSLLDDAEKSQNDDLIAMALMDLTMSADDGNDPPEPGKCPYHTYSAASANIRFLRSFLTQTWAGETEPTRNGLKRLGRFAEYVRENITHPGGELISSSDLDQIMAALEKRYGLISRLSRLGALQILRIPNSHRKMNSVCNAAKRMDGTDGFRYELYLFHCRDEESGHPAYILLHEIGHALQVELTRDPARIPESFCKMSDYFLGKPVEQSPLATELFADAFAIGMIRIFGWEAYGAFDELAPEVKHVFANYMDWLLEREVPVGDHTPSNEPLSAEEENRK